MVPDKNHYWEGFATFNLCPVARGKKIYGLYRALSVPDSMQKPTQISTIGIAESKDGARFENRRQFIIPAKDWDMFGCEDPRVTFFEGKYYIFYTGISAFPPDSKSIKVGVAISKDMKKIEERHLVTPFNAKAMTLFPERINGKIAVIFSIHTDEPPAEMVVAYLSEIEDLWNPSFWKKWEENFDQWIINPRRGEKDHVEVGAPPIKTKYGWLLIYSHIQNYFNPTGNENRIFGIEGLLLDLKDPRKIIGRTRGPILVPEEHYELSGYVNDVVFPSGAMVSKDILTIYYGAADTTACLAKVSLKDLVSSMHEDLASDWHFKRFPDNPILSPEKYNSWESKAVFNPAALLVGGKIHILYRALSEDNTSTFGYAMTEDGFLLKERSLTPIYSPREDFEIKKIENANSGCEDPRLTKIGKQILVCYTAFDGIGPPRVAVSVISEKDFLARKWNWTKPHLITPEGLDDKDACFLPEKLKEGYFVLHRIEGEICGDYLSTLDFSKKEVLNKCIRIIGPRLNKWDSSKVGIAAPPMKTKHGWLLLYHGVSKNHNTYRLGALLLDLKDPAIVLARSTDTIFEPEEEYEKVGIVNNVVFPCGMVLKGDQLFIYYGGADKVVGGATISLKVILGALVRGMKLK
ncbi:MAG TPA: hypothetical protein VFQ59_02855 [Candidatus Paceibacterota bacterium]|nr:hypothetical protein [Candidatus Paceibacterota bacterium]